GARSRITGGRYRPAADESDEGSNQVGRPRHADRSRLHSGYRFPQLMSGAMAAIPHDLRTAPGTSLPLRMDRRRMTKKVKLAYLVSHPIQYQAPLLRRIAQEPDIDLTVFFGSDFSVRGYKDEGFGVEVKWDVPLLEGYRHEFLPVLRDGTKVTVTTPLNYGIFSHLRGRNGEAPFDVLWSH